MVHAHVLADRQLRRSGLEIALAVMVQLIALDGVCFGPRRLWWAGVLVAAWVWHTQTLRRTGETTTTLEDRALRDLATFAGLCWFAVLIGLG